MGQETRKHHYILNYLANAASNTSVIVQSVFSNPTKDSMVLLNWQPSEEKSQETISPNRLSPPVHLSRFYKQVVIGVLVAAVVCLLIEVALGFAWSNPTSAQQTAIAAIDFGWKSGVGLIIGLLTGKQV